MLSMLVTPETSHSDMLSTELAPLNIPPMSATRERSGMSVALCTRFGEPAKALFMVFHRMSPHWSMDARFLWPILTQSTLPVMLTCPFQPPPKSWRISAGRSRGSYPMMIGSICPLGGAETQGVVDGPVAARERTRGGEGFAGRRGASHWQAPQHPVARYVVAGVVDWFAGDGLHVGAPVYGVRAGGPQISTSNQV